MPQYELKAPFYQENGPRKDNGDGTSSLSIIITVGIVGDPYGFVPINPSKRVGVVSLPNKGCDIEQCMNLCMEAAEAIRLENFPDTK